MDKEYGSIQAVDLGYEAAQAQGRAHDGDEPLEWVAKPVAPDRVRLRIWRGPGGPDRETLFDEEVPHDQAIDHLHEHVFRPAARAAIARADRSIIGEGE